jgi:hypothetical protein
MYHKYNLAYKTITLTFETNEEHQARSYQNAMRYSVITKLLAGKTNDKYIIT